jgi:voltage-gated potassium channel
MPVVGVISLAQGLADFGSLFFNRKSRNKEWEMAVASTLKNHIILIGFGHLGYRVATTLHEMGKQLVVIEQNPRVDTLNDALQLGIPVITEDATRVLALEGANIKKAKTLILASQNDAMNLQIALKARSINPNIKIVIRIFDDDFAHALQEQFGFIALSATEMAAPVFAAAAAGADVTNPISVEGQLLSLAKLTVAKDSAFKNKTIGHLENFYKINVVLLRQAQETFMPPKFEQTLTVNDVVAVIGAPQQLNKILHDNERK